MPKELFHLPKPYVFPLDLAACGIGDGHIPSVDHCRGSATELRILVNNATRSDLTDGGRYFADDCSDLTRCRHEEIGEYQNQRDGPLVEWLWNNREEIIALYQLAAMVAETTEQGNNGDGR